MERGSDREGERGEEREGGIEREVERERDKARRGGENERGGGETCDCVANSFSFSFDYLDPCGFNGELRVGQQGEV